jgi:chemotaxis response regulator CheB
VDDQALVRGGFRVLVDSAADLEVVGEAENGRQAVELVQELEPDVVLMDVRMPEMDGLATTEAIAGLGTRTRVLMLTSRPHRHARGARRGSRRIRHVIVLAASALVDVIVDQPAKEHVLAHLDQPIVAPSHQLAEVLSALGRLVRADVITLKVARAALDEAAALDQEHVVPRSRHCAGRSTYRIESGFSTAAMLRWRKNATVTTDARLAAARAPCEVILAERSSGT